MAHPTSLSAAEALRRLVEGNRRYATGQVDHPHQAGERRRELLKGQLPFAAMLGCADSRVPPEIVFDQGLGDLFVVRVAGNVLDETVLGSLEYAVEHLGVSLIVVLGHSACGAVTAAAAGGAAEGHVASLVEKLQPAIEQARQAQDVGNALVEAAIEIHALRAAEELRLSEPILAQRTRSGALSVVAALYNLETGVVRWL